MDWQSFDTELNEAQQRARMLRASAGRGADGLSTAALAELDTALEELSVVQEALRSQHETIIERSRSLLADSAEKRRAPGTVRPLAGRSGEARLEINADGRIVAATAAAAALLGVELQMLSRKPLAAFIPETQHAAWHIRLSELAHTPADVQWLQPLAPRGRPGCTFSVRAAAHPVRAGIFVLTLSEPESQSSSPAADDENEFLLTVVHELRTPLNAVTSYLKLLRDPGLDPALRARAIDVIERNTALQAQLVTDLADHARQAMSEAVAEYRHLDLRQVVADAAESMRPTAEAAGHALHIELGRDPVWINGDAARLQQVAGNLLSNAVKFSPPGGRIVISAITDGPYAVLRVSDTGMGIPEELRPRMFQPFSRGARERKRGVAGLGLGLWIVRHLVEVHGGTVTLTSPVSGPGTIVTVRLPALHGALE